MATILLAIGDPELREACRSQLQAAAHAPVQLRRTLSALTLWRKVACDAVCLDDSLFGREALAVLQEPACEAPLIGLGLEAEGLAASIALPLEEMALLRVLDELLAHGELQRPADGLEIDARRRVARANGREVELTPTQVRLLELLLLRRGSDVSADKILEAVWGSSEGVGGTDLVRAHVRNLRRRLAEIGLGDAIRSRRGRGYALVV